jgi:hypothetical protein
MSPLPPNTIALTQSEQVLENELVAQLIGQGYTQVAVKDEVSMLANLKAQLGAFNGLELTDGEFTKVLHHLNKSAGVFNKAKTLRDTRLHHRFPQQGASGCDDWQIHSINEMNEC